MIIIKEKDFERKLSQDKEHILENLTKKVFEENMLEIADHQRKLSLPLKQIQEDLEKVMEELGLSEKIISLAFVDNSKIAELHKKYLNIEGDTDVLSFSLSDHEEDPFLGEVIVSAEKAKDEAESRGHSWIEELLLYSIHGILHLIGYNDLEAKEKKEMEKKHLDLLHSLGYHQIQ